MRVHFVLLFVLFTIHSHAQYVFKGFDVNTDIGSGGNCYPSSLTACNGKLFFAADDGTHGKELWMTDGTTTGTKMLADIYPGAASSSPTNITTLGKIGRAHV